MDNLKQFKLNYFRSSNATVNYNKDKNDENF